MWDSKTEEYISKSVGLPYEEIVNMSDEDLDAHIEKKIGKKLKPSCDILGFFGRGSVYLYLKRLIKMEDIEKRLAKI